MFINKINTHNTSGVRSCHKLVTLKNFQPDENNVAGLALKDTASGLKLENLPSHWISVRYAIHTFVCTVHYFVYFLKNHPKISFPPKTNYWIKHNGIHWYIRVNPRYSINISINFNAHLVISYSLLMKVHHRSPSTWWC